MTEAGANTIWARTFVDELARVGVKTVCLAPGSRSTPLVLAAAGHPAIQVVTHVDERSAAFFALGVGKATRRPAAVITTSGTAAANLFPAVIEASQGAVPLLLLTADRPHRLRDADANQAIDQLRLYGPYVRRFFEMAPPSRDGDSLRHLRTVAARAVAETAGPRPGPVHLNFPFAKPLEPAPGDPDEGRGGLAGRAGGLPIVEIAMAVASPSEEAVGRVAELVERSVRGLIVAGPHPEPWRVGPAAAALAAATGLPLLADPLSGARFGPSHGAVVVGAYDLFLRDPDLRRGLAPDLIVRLGATPTSAALGRLIEESAAAAQVVVDGGQRWKDHMSVASVYLDADPGLFAVALAAQARRSDPEWRGLWARADAAARRAARGEGEGDALSEAAIATRAAAGVPENGMLFVSNSMPVRDLDAFGEPREQVIRALGNRGASGIDGIVSTALGLSLGASAPVVALLGDLAFLHDMNGLLATREPGVRTVFVVIHNDGGGIFHMLPVRRFEPEFTAHFAAPHGRDFRHAASLYDLPYQRVDSLNGLENAIAEALLRAGSSIVEVRTDREQNRLHRQAAAERVAGAVTHALNQEERA